MYEKMIKLLVVTMLCGGFVVSAYGQAWLYQYCRTNHSYYAQQYCSRYLQTSGPIYYSGPTNYYPYYHNNHYQYYNNQYYNRYHSNNYYGHYQGQYYHGYHGTGMNNAYRRMPGSFHGGLGGFHGGGHRR